MATQMGNRLVFENAKTLIQQLGYDASHAVLTPSFLRSEFLLTTTSAAYHVPVLINDNSAPFDIYWEAFCLSFDTSKDSWNTIYSECINLINDIPRYNAMQKLGIDYF